MFKFLASLVFLASPVFAQTANLPVRGDLLPGWREADGSHMAGLSLDLEPGWKTYWRAPGSGGIPPRFNWSGSQNLAHVEVRYPVPKVMDQNGIRAIGYDRDVILPLIVTARDASKPVRIRAEVEIGVCEEVCIPMTLRLAVTLPAKGAYDAGIGASLERQPIRGGRFACKIAPISDGLRFQAHTKEARFKADIAVIETDDPNVWVSESETTQQGGTVVAEVEMVPPNAQPFALSRSTVRMTLIGDGRAIEMRGCS